MAPTATAAPTDSPAPTDAVNAFDPRNLLFEDDFSDPNSGWGVGSTPGGEIGYSDGALHINTSTTGQWVWTRRLTGGVNGALRLAGQFVPSSDGYFGLMCASGDEQLYGALIGTDGSWAFVQVSDAGTEVLDGDQGAGLTVPVGDVTLLAVECAGLSTGAFRMQVWLGGTGPLAMYESDEGPDNFDRVAYYGEAGSDNYGVRLEQAYVFGVTGADGQMDADGQALLAHVPEDWQGSCFQSAVPPFLGGEAATNLVCFIGQPGSEGFEVVEYAQYSSKDQMDVAYQRRVDNFGTGVNAESCGDNSGEHSYTIDDTESGRLLCVEQVVGIRFDWTDDRLIILAAGVDYDSSYAASYEDWQGGGPDV